MERKYGILWRFHMGFVECWDLLGFVGISHQIIGIILGRMGMNYENINYIWGFPARHGGTTTLDGL